MSAGPVSRWTQIQKFREAKKLRSLGPLCYHAFLHFSPSESRTADAQLIIVFTHYPSPDNTENQGD